MEENAAIPTQSPLGGRSLLRPFDPCRLETGGGPSLADHGFGSTEQANAQRRQTWLPDRPCQGPSRVQGFRTGDLVRAVCPPHLKTAGTRVGRVLVRTRGSFDIQTRQGRVKDISARYCRRVQASDGYRYALGEALPRMPEGSGPPRRFLVIRPRHAPGPEPCPDISGDEPPNMKRDTCYAE